MIGINDITALGSIESASSSTKVIPNEFEIDILVGNTTFANSTAITTAFKNLLKEISNACGLYNFLSPVSATLRAKISQMFIRIGFSKNTSGIITFNPVTNALDIGTSLIINNLHGFTNSSQYNDKAYNAFHNNSWAKQANDIRGMAGSGLTKQHQITVTKVDVESNVQDINNMSNLLNNISVDNRFVFISAVPAMPRIKIKNNTNVSLKVRVKIKYVKTANANGTGATKRVFLNYFPDQNSSDSDEIIGTVHVYTKVLATQTSWEVDFENKIRGGDLTIEFIESSSVWDSDSIGRFYIFLRAKNPTVNNVRTYLNAIRVVGDPNSSYLSRYWFMLKLIRQEADTNPNNANEFLHFNRAPNDIYLRNNNLFGLPSLGNPKGWGLGQIDNLGEIDSTQFATLGITQQQVNDIQPGGSKEYRTIVDNQGRTIDYELDIVASDDVVWNWKKNIDKMIEFYESKISEIVPRINTIRNQINAWNNAHPNDLVVFPVNQIEGNITYGAIRSDIDGFDTYNDIFPTTPVGTATYKSFFDAMLIKYYNGVGTEGLHYLYLSSSPGTKPVLSIKNFSTRIENGVQKVNYYVRDVSNQAN